MGVANACNPYLNGPRGSVPPILLLLHELDHFNDSSNAKEFIEKRNKNYERGENGHEWSNESERQTITKSEWGVAKEMGWMRRLSHRTKYPGLPLRIYQTPNTFGPEDSER